MDNVAAVNITLETRHEYNLTTICASYDLKAAFDTVDRPWAFHALRRLAVPEHLIRLCEALYRDCSGSVRQWGAASETFPLRSGLRQGSLLSPLLFNALIHYVMQRTFAGLQARFASLTANVYAPRDFFAHFEYADDILILSSEADIVQHFTAALAEELRLVGLQFNTGKCKVMTAGPTATPTFTHPALQQHEARIKYLGTLVPAQDSQEALHRIQRAQGAFAQLGKAVLLNHRLPIALRARIYDATVRAVLLYGLGGSVLKEGDKKALGTCERAFLRRMCQGWQLRPVGPIPRIVWIPVPNAVLYRRTHLQKIGALIERKRWSWFLHIARRDDVHITKSLIHTLVTTAPQTKRSPGGQKSTWLRQMVKAAKTIRPGTTGLHSMWHWATSLSRSSAAVILQLIN